MRRILKTSAHLILGVILTATAAVGAPVTKAGGSSASTAGWSSTWTEPQTDKERQDRAFDTQLTVGLKTHDYRPLLAEAERQAQAHPNEWLSYSRRGIAHACAKQFDLARADYGRALEIAQRVHSKRGVAIILFNRAHLAQEQGHWEAAVADLRQSMRVDSDYVSAIESLAWLRATCPDVHERNGMQAVDLAHRACDMTGGNNAGYTDTLAAAYAEKGDFSRAVEEQRRSLAQFHKQARHDVDHKFEAGATTRLALYQKREAFRDDHHDDY